ncbi:hypothetical protein NC652_009190 [Populus alba x Populus x berolinensis]|uniref:Uncharacterized protein n=1 Tax=Populus alba x Populus x berolinensis TaxID=444605 RepID=A0AAD6R9M0_9ROSI|nr:hypothetical protein NC652_009190 [Populus alba x Populus x berolinensis]KAJ7004242.1 hypothetical protein NC653_009198 [Populus alba x Populus x berolinensis]KAJ7005374.1 hypothetical protein NC653_010007 [Populus alba x Populus x berolinensis]
MGNCIRSSKIRQHEEEDNMEELHQEKKETRIVKGASLKVKIVLTKEELEWLTFQLKVNGGRKLEDVLKEIERGRMRVKTWKPSLESIMETPEGLETERRAL